LQESRSSRWPDTNSRLGTFDPKNQVDIDVSEAREQVMHEISNKISRRTRGLCDFGSVVLSTLVPNSFGRRLSSNRKKANAGKVDIRSVSNRQTGNGRVGLKWCPECRRAFSITAAKYQFRRIPGMVQPCGFKTP